MLINSQLLKDHFGQYYKIQTSKDKPAPLPLEAEVFRSNAQATQFINNLKAPISFWSKIVNSETLLLKSISNEKLLKEQVAELFSRGKIKAFKIDIPSLSQHAPEKRTVKDSNKNTHTFVPASSLLITNPREVKKFTNTAEANKYLKELSPKKEELQNLAKELDLPVTVADNELLALVAEGLAAGTIVVVVDRYSAPPSSGAEADGAVHSDKDASKGPETPQCTFDVMTVECSHFGKGRSYKLDVIKDKPNLNGIDKALQVIARPGEPDEISVTYSGSCANSSKECPAVKVSSDTLNGTFIENPYKFNALPLEDEREPGDFMDFLKYYLVPDINGLKYQVYTIEKSGCNGNEGNIAKIHAFPTFKWDGSVSLGYQQPDGTNDDGKNFGKKKKESEWKISAKLNGNVGDKNWAFETSDKKDAERYMPGLQNSIRGLVYKLDEFYRKADSSKGLVKFNMTWPSLSLGGNIELIEATDDFDVDIGGEIYFNFSPLIKADVKMDLLEWLLLFTTPLGPFLQEIKTKAATDGIGSKNLNAKAVIAIDLILTGEASTTLNWKKSAKDKWLSTSGDKVSEATAGITIGLEAKIKAEAKIFYVKITFGAELHVKGAKNASQGIGVFFTLFATTEKDKPAIGGKVDFTGAAIYYTYYSEIGSDELQSDQADPSNNRQRGKGGKFASKKSNKESKGRGNKMEKLTEIFKSDYWPKNKPLESNEPSQVSDIDL